MQIPLNQFENYIDETILKRGLSYFQNGYVQEPEEITCGEFQAIVEGTDDYTVHLSINKGIITEYSCTCPYDMGPICKHVTALIFYLQQDVLGLEVKQKSKTPTTKTKKPTKRKTIAEKIDELLDEVSHEELKQFVKKAVLEDKLLREGLEIHFLDYTLGNSKDFYVKKIQALVKASKNSNGYISYSKVNKLFTLISKYLDVAKNNIANNNELQAIFIGAAVMEEIIKIFSYTDDRNNFLGDLFNDSFDILKSIAQNNPSDSVRIQLLNYAMDVYKRAFFEQWGLHMDIVNLAASLVKTDTEVDTLIIQLKSNISNIIYKDSHEKLIYELLVKFKRLEEAKNYLEQNISNPSFRLKALETAYQNHNYSKAKLLANEAIKEDDSRSNITWYEWLLKIAQAENNIKTIIEVARYLLLQGYDSGFDNYYALLQQHIAPEEWNGFVEKMIAETKKKPYHLSYWLLPKFYIKQEQWECLFDFVKSTERIDTLVTYEKYLVNDYFTEIMDMYKKYILHSLNRAAQRSEYQKACEYIQRVVTLGGVRNAEIIISYLVTTQSPKKSDILL